MFTYDLSIFLTSTAFVDTNTKIRYASFEIYRIFEKLSFRVRPLPLPHSCLARRGTKNTTAEKVYLCKTLKTLYVVLFCLTIHKIWCKIGMLKDAFRPYVGGLQNRIEENERR